MTRRFHITIDAKTSAGGIVTSATHFASTNGLRLALEGDSIDCPACHSKGRIRCDGPRVSSTVDGKECALSDDLCMCNCDPPPRLIAIQEHMYQFVSADAAEDWTPPSRYISSAIPGATHDLTFVLKDQSGQTLAGYLYLIELPDGTRLEGISDRHGLTCKISAMAAELATLTVYTLESSPIEPDWDR